MTDRELALVMEVTRQTFSALGYSTRVQDQPTARRFVQSNLDENEIRRIARLVRDEIKKSDD